MVEVVVAFAQSDKSGDDMIARRIAVVEGLVTEPVSKTVDAEGGLLDEEDTKDARIHQATYPIVPEDAGNARREDKSHD